MSDTEKTVQALLDRHGTTFPEELGIEIARNTPAPLFQTLCLALLFSARIRASIAVDAMRALLESGWTTAQHMANARLEDRVRALNDAGYALERYGGDLRELRGEAGRDPDEERRLLEDIKGVGDVGVDIFFRDAQAAWTELYPFADRKSLQGARRLGLPDSAEGLAELVDDTGFPRLVTALVRMELAGDADDIRSAAGR